MTFRPGVWPSSPFHSQAFTVYIHAQAHYFHASLHDVMLQVEKSFLQYEGRCRDGVNYEIAYQQETSSAENKNHTPIPV